MIKRLLLLLFSLTVLIALGAISINPAIAANTTDALYTATVRVTNNSTAETGVSTNFSASSADFIAGSFMNSSANNTAILSAIGADVPYMPGYGDTNPWIIFVNAIGANTMQDNTLYMGGSTDMTSNICIFLGDEGMTTPDDPTLEPGANFTISQTGYPNTVTGDSRYLVLKHPDFASQVIGTNITAGITDNVSWTNPTGYDDPASAWTNDSNAFDENTGTYASDAAVGAGAWSEYLILTHSEFITDSVRAWTGGSNPPDFTLIDVDVYYNSAWNNVYQGAVTHGSFQSYNMTSYQSANATRLRLYNSGGVARNAYIYEVDFGIASFGAYSVTATGIASENQTVLISANITDLWISIDGSIKDTVSLSGDSIADNSDNWTFILNSAMLYLQSQEITVNGVTRQEIAWEYGSTFTDLSGNSNNCTPTLRTTSSDQDISAELLSFGPISEAKAPAYTLDVSTTGWITGNITQSGNFTTTTNSTYPGSDVISEVTTAGNVPVQLLELILACVIVLSLSLFISWIMRQHNEGSIFVKILVIAAGLGIMIAIAVVDSWILYLFLIISIAIAMGASQRVFTGTGTAGNNMIGFLTMSFVGMTMINRILEGRVLQDSDVDTIRNVLAFQPFEVFGVFTIPVPNTGFLTNGLPALMMWDYSYFGGNAQIFQYLLYSITAAVSFILLVLVFGAVYQMFSRPR